MRKTLGEQLLDLKARSGLSLNEIAQAAGFKGASSLQRYFNAEYDGDALSYRLTLKLITALEGQGTPPIQENELLNLAEHHNISIKKEVPEASKKAIDVQDYIDVYATLPHTLDFNMEDAPIWADGLIVQSDVAVETFRCPPSLERRDVYGIYAPDISMSPRFQQGEIVFTEGKKPAAVGDDVLVKLKESIEGGRHSISMLARLQAIEGNVLILRHFSGQTYPFPLSQIASTRRVLRSHELLGT